MRLPQPGQLPGPAAASSAPAPRAAGTGAARSPRRASMVASAARGAAGELRVRGRVRVLQPQVVGQHPEHVGRVVGPAGQAQVDLGHRAVPVPGQERGQPVLQRPGQRAAAGTAAASSAAGVPLSAAADAASPRTRAASAHSSRSISEVTLCGSDRSTSSAGAGRPSRRRPRPGPRAAGPVPAPTTGNIRGTVGKVRLSSRSTPSSRCSAGQCRRAAGPARGRGRSSRSQVAPGGRRADQRQQRHRRHPEPGQGPQRAAHERAPGSPARENSGLLDQRAQHHRRAGLHHVEHPRQQPPADRAAQRGRDVDEQPARPGSAARPGRPADRPPGRRRPRRRAARRCSRNADMPIGVIGRTRPWARLTQKKARGPSARPLGQRVQRGDRPGLGEPERAGPRRSPTRCPAGHRTGPRPGGRARPARATCASVRLRAGRAAPADLLGAAAGARPDRDGLVALPVLGDRAVALDHDVVRVDRAGHHGLAEPGAASMTVRVRRPVTGSAVNSTPASSGVHHPLHDHGEPTRRGGRCRRRAR